MAIRPPKPSRFSEEAKLAAKEHKARLKRAATAKRTGTQAKRKASRSPGGYQSGRTVNPRAAGAAAMRRNRPKQRRIRFEGYGSAYDRLSGKGGGWVEGGAVENYNDQVKRKYGGGKL